MKTEEPENQKTNDGFREIPDAVGNRLIVPDEVLRSVNFALPEYGKQTALLLEQYRASEEFPRLGVAVRLTAPIMRKMIHVCDTNYTHVLAIIVKGFVRIRKERSGGADDESDGGCARDFAERRRRRSRVRLFAFVPLPSCYARLRRYGDWRVATFFPNFL